MRVQFEDTYIGISTLSVYLSLSYRYEMHATAILQYIMERDSDVLYYIPLINTFDAKLYGKLSVSN